MPPDFTNIDVAWAWQPYEPSPDRPWSRRLAAHLYRRAVFAASWAELDRALSGGPAATLDRLCNPPTPDESSAAFERSITELAERTAEGGNTQQLAAWWVYRILKTPDPF